MKAVRSVFLFVVLFLVALIIPCYGETPITILRSFTGGSDGSLPRDSLIQKDSTLYGMTNLGGSAPGWCSTGCGTIFSINTNGSNYQILHSFAGGADDGASPFGSLVLSGSTLYGTTYGGGSGCAGMVGCGTLFSINTNGSNFQVLHSFTEGGSPYSGSLAISGSTLYGMTGPTVEGGVVTDWGTIFSIDTDGNNFQVLHSFAGGDSDGGGAHGGLILSDSTLYGMTAWGGSGCEGTGCGTIFSINTDGNNLQLLHSFTWYDGSQPQGSPVLSGSTLYGMTMYGGSESCYGFGCGTIFSINTDGSDFKVLHTFTWPDGARDGADSRGTLTLFGPVLYGMSYGGGGPDCGNWGCGTIFSINTDGSDFQVLHSFMGGVSDGGNPRGSLVLSGSSLFGMTYSGGGTGCNGTGCGIIFSLRITAKKLLTAVKSGAGSGRVTSMPSGIDCGATCVAAYPKNTAVTLTASPDSGSTFAGWHSACAGTGLCNVTMSDDLTVTAAFNLKSYSLGAAVQGHGTISADGITCKGTTCRGVYPHGTEVSFIATPNTEESFISWSGCDTADGTTCTVVMTSDRSVTAAFTSLNPCTYTVSPLNNTFAYHDGSLTVAITGKGASDCPAPDTGVSPDTAWITLSPVTFAKNKGSLKVNVSENDNPSKRKGTVTVENKSIAVAQKAHPPTGCLTVTIQPPEAVAAGARWKVGAGSWRQSGATVCGVSSGSRTVTFMAIPGWSTPSNQAVTITTGRTSSTTGTYSPPISLNLPNPLGSVERCGQFDYQIPAPTGGVGGPWTFTLGPMGGFPPLGITVGPGGMVSGVPSSPVGDYHFKVCVADAAFAQTCKPTLIRVTPPLHPGKPSPSSPANGSKGVSPGTSLNWTVTANTDSYDVYLGTAFPPPKVANVTGPGYLPPVPLKTGATYYWQVISKHDMCGGVPPTVAGGPVWSFTTSNLAVDVSSASCVQTHPCQFGYCGDLVTVSGTGCGPVGARLWLGSNAYSIQCGPWQLDAANGTCNREASDPPCTDWEFTDSGEYYYGQETFSGELHINYEGYTGWPVLASWTAICPQCPAVCP